MTRSEIETRWAPRVLSILRIMSGLLLLQHGTAKLLGYPAGAVPPGFDLMSLAGYAGFIEFICGILLVVGLFTRFAACIASGMTAVAYFYVHARQSFFPILNHGELAVLYCFVFLYIAVAGPGPWSIDFARRTR